MTNRNPPLSVNGRERLVRCCQTRPIASVAVERGISPACASKRVNRQCQYGDLGLQDGNKDCSRVQRRLNRDLCPWQICASAGELGW